MVKGGDEMLVTPDLSRKIDEIMPGLQTEIRKNITAVEMLRLPIQTGNFLTEIMLSVGDISLLIKKTKELTEVVDYGKRKH